MTALETVKICIVTDLLKVTDIRLRIPKTELSNNYYSAIHSVCRNVLLRGPAWAVGSYSSGPPAGGIPQILIC